MKIVNVLSIDGGGLRGIVPAVMLDALQTALGGAPLHSTFDLIAGTSTGGLIALGLGCPANAGHPYTPAQMRDVYCDRGAEIFPQRWYNQYRQWWRPKYSADGLQTVLESLFGAARLSSALAPLLICSYDLGGQIPFFFKSRRGPNDDPTDWPLVDVGRATSAAPTYLPAYAVANAQGKGYTFVDGGLYVNNPVMAAYAEAMRLHPGADSIRVVAAGTGNTCYSMDAAAARRWGKLQWASQIAPVMMDGVSEAGDYEAKHICVRAGDRFWRLQPQLESRDSAMDNPDPAALLRLRAVAESYVQQNRATFAAIAAALAGGSAAPAGAGQTYLSAR